MCWEEIMQPDDVTTSSGDSATPTENHSDNVYILGFVLKLSTKQTSWLFYSAGSGSSYWVMCIRNILWGRRRVVERLETSV